MGGARLAGGQVAGDAASLWCLLMLAVAWATLRRGYGCEQHEDGAGGAVWYLGQAAKRLQQAVAVV